MSKRKEENSSFYLYPFVPNKDLYHSELPIPKEGEGGTLYNMFFGQMDYLQPPLSKSLEYSTFSSRPTSILSCFRTVFYGLISMLLVLLYSKPIVYKNI